MGPTRLFTLLLTTGLMWTGCAADGALQTGTDEANAVGNRLARATAADCGMESCAPAGTLVSTEGALLNPVRTRFTETVTPDWAPGSGEMVRMRVKQVLFRPNWAVADVQPCEGPDCWADARLRFCEVTDQDGRVLWLQNGNADQWVHLRGVESIRTRVFGHSQIMRHHDYCDVTAVEVLPSSVEDDPPDSSCATYFATDFSYSVDSILSINGDASQPGDDDGYLLLTDTSRADQEGAAYPWNPYSGMGAGHQAGSAFAMSAISDPRWTARFSFEIKGDNSGRTGADGMTFAFVDARTPDALGGDGSKLGVEGLWGYAVEFDTYQNDNDPNDNHIALIDTLTGEHLVVASDIPRLQDGGEFEAEVRYDYGHLEVWLDGVPTLSARILTQVPNFVQPAAIFGFTASTGSKTNNHIVDDVIIQPLCDGGADSSVNSEGWAGTVSEAEWDHFGPIEVDAGTLVVTMTGTGDADLYVREGARPTKANWDCRPYGGTSDEECRLEGAGSYYVGVRGYGAPASDYDVSYRIEASPSSTGQPSQTYEVASEEWLHFSPVELDASSTLVLTMTGTGDADLYARKGSEPTEATWDCRPFASTSEEQCRLEGAGTWYFGVRGYASPSSTFTLSYTIDERGSDVGIDESGTLGSGEWAHFGPFEVDAGTLVAALTGTGDADLYVREGAEPTSTAYDCRPYSTTSDEECRLDGPGDFYVSVKGYAQSSSSFGLTVEVQPDS